MPTGTSYGYRMVRARTSQTSTNAAPVSAVTGSTRRRLSPIARVTRLGTTRPRKGIDPTLTTTIAVTTEAMARPTMSTRV
jgi:hypothetical protein